MSNKPYLDNNGLSYLWSKIKALKQDKITGTAGQIVGFDAEGKPAAQDFEHTHSFNDLEDKPFYSETDDNGDTVYHKMDGNFLPEGTPWIESEMATILPECTLAVDESEGVAPIMTPFSLTIGQPYTVTYNGQQFECVAQDAIDMGFGICVGNLGALLGEGDTGEPFIIADMASEQMGNPGFEGAAVPLDGNTEVTICIEGPLVTFHTLPETLMPDVRTYFVKGNAEGSMRHTNSVPEDESYQLGEYAFAEGWNTKASGSCSHAEGVGTTASGSCSHAEGSGAAASFDNSHAEGYQTKASGHSSHAEGYCTNASGDKSHAEGESTTASGNHSHAEGLMTIAAGNHQHAQGRYNIEDVEGKYAHIVGNGYEDIDRSNAHTVDWSGNAWYQGDVYVGGTGQDDTAAVKLSKEGHEHLFDRAITTSGDGAAYTATVEGITALTAGISFTMIPHTASTSKTATLNVNGLGAKQLRRPVSSNNSTTVANTTDNWLYANRPVEVMYNGTYWVVTSMARPNGPDIYGTVPGTSVGYDNTTSGMTATTMQAAIDELYALISQLQS